MCAKCKSSENRSNGLEYFALNPAKYGIFFVNFYEALIPATIFVWQK